MVSRVAPPPAEGQVRVRMTVAYDGTPFHGFATNPDVRTVQDDLEAALSTVLREPITLTCAGRTDRGVHARGQVVSFDADAGHFDAVALTRALNRMLAPAIAVRDVGEAAPDFDARFSCVARTYRYRILNAATPDPLVHNLSWHVREPLEVAAMQIGADRVLGEHDFSSFSKKNKSKKNNRSQKRQPSPQPQQQQQQQQLEEEKTLEEYKVDHSKILTKIHEEASAQFKSIRQRLNNLAIERSQP